MKRYETIFIASPDLSEEQHKVILDRTVGLMPQHQGLLVKTEKWGIRKMAYEIKKKTRGYYVLLDYCGNGSLVDEIERLSRIDDGILKYMTILTDPDVDIEKVKEEIAQAVAKAEEKSSQEIAAQAAAKAEEKSSQEAAAQPASEQPEESAKQVQAAEVPEKETPETGAAGEESAETDQPQSNKEES